MNDLISIIVPVYKVERYLPKCIDSILEQTYKNYELILVDDGSPDKCGEICDQYAARDDRIIVIHKDNGGLSSARNVGIEIAQGEFISFIDSDDSVHREFLEVLHRLCKDNNCDIAICDYLAVEYESIKLDRQKDEVVEIINSYDAVERSCLELEPMEYTFAWNKLYSKELFENVRYPKGKIHEDDFTTYLLLWKSRRVAVTNLYLYWYQQRKDSIMGRRFDRSRLDRLEAFRNKLYFLKSHGMTEVYQELVVVYYRLLWATYDQVNESVEEPIEILDEIEREARYYEYLILNMQDKTDIEKARLIYPHQADDIQERYRMRYGDTFIDSHTEFFLFPFDKVPRGSKVALYGAGMVGRVYYIEVNSLDYCNIKYWVDMAWYIISRKIKTVCPIDVLFRKIDYDYIVVAVRTKETAQIAINNLIDWGIPKEKIIWKEPNTIPLLSRTDTIR